MVMVGCGAKQEIQVRQQENIQRTMLYRDSLDWKLMTTGLQQRKVNIRHIRLSPPDSCNLQYVESITEMEENADAQYENTSVFQSESEKKEFIEEKRKNKENIRKEIKAGSFPTGLVIGVLLVVCAVFWFSFYLKRL